MNKIKRGQVWEVGCYPTHLLVLVTSIKPRVQIIDCSSCNGRCSGAEFNYYTKDNFIRRIKAAE